MSVICGAADESKGGEGMDASSCEKARDIAEKTGWTLTQAEGYVEGELYRRGGLRPTAYQKVGVDDYAKGFRAGFFQQENRPVVDSGSD
jgi:hypothetical protein